ncbi:MAG: hypothetical protein K9W45_12460 [Candidatus Heimdallarchaeum aukensis]|uniref:Uncharacterized protein n=1 Tax=Candidatus Heimdallarchaeum aukensis TaxID=2876573 RepID=A0A9Y1FLJ9_9ARCH|nr:MAG: hypothetical protein K9W45_12460 [Candidatus Heimdallarchaeum aukensis]
MIQNLIISNQAGIPLFARSLMCHIGVHCVDLSKEATIDDESLLKSALFSAKIIYDGAQSYEFHLFEMEKSIVLSYQTERINAIFALKPPVNVDEYTNRLRLMAELFDDNFGEKIDLFNGDISAFNEFQNIIAENGLLEEGEKFRKNCVNCKYDKACAFRVFTGDTSRSLKEIFDSIKPLNFFKKMFLIIIGMLSPRYI